MNYNLSLDINLFLKATDTSLKMMAKRISVSLDVLSKVVNNKINPTDDLIEKIYSYIYDCGLRLNEEKSRYYSSQRNVVLFHASKDELIGTPSLSYSRQKVDLGVGFYTGETYEQSLDFVCARDKGSIYVFDVNYHGLKIKKLGVTLEWVLWVAYNRGLLEEYNDTKIYKNIQKEMNEFDVVIAPIADNRMFSTIDDFVNNGITSNTAINALNSLSIGNQVVFKSEESLKHLTSLDRLYLCKKEKEDARHKKLVNLLNTNENVRKEYAKNPRDGLFIKEVFENEKI